MRTPTIASARSLNGDPLLEAAGAQDPGTLDVERIDLDATTNMYARHGTGSRVIVVRASSKAAEIRVSPHSERRRGIPMRAGDALTVPFQVLFLSWDAQPGEWVEIATAQTHPVFFDFRRGRNLVELEEPVSVEGGDWLTDAQLRAAAVPVSGPLTDAQLRAAAVPVSGPLTDAQMRASAVPVSGPLTDAQLRASRVPTRAAQDRPTQGGTRTYKVIGGFDRNATGVLADSATGADYTVPSGKTFYATSIVLVYLSDSTLTRFAAEIRDGEGGTALLPLLLPSIVAGRGDACPFPEPLRFSAGNKIQVAITNGSGRWSLSFIGYEE